MDQMDALEEMVARAKGLPPVNPDRHDYDSDRLFRDGYARVIEVVGEHRHLAWGTMVYACSGQRVGFAGKGEGCGWEHRVWMGVGVEGPPALRDLTAYIPAPFICGTCPDCGSPLAHARWQDDEEWDDLRELPGDVAYFVVPTEKRARKSVKNGYGGSEYVDPTGKTRVTTVRSA